MNYSTPLGAFEFWSDAAEACERADLDPCTCIEYLTPARTIPTVSLESAYGSDFRLSHQIKVF